MSDLKQRPRSLDPRSRRDGGYTLPELLIAVAMLGIITAVLSAAIIVVIRQQDSTVGRLDGARAEQSFDTWMPADLASFNPTTVTTDTTLDPCSAPCDGIDISGVNTLMASWDVDGSTVTVSYQYIEVGARMAAPAHRVRSVRLPHERRAPRHVAATDRITQ